MILKAYSGSAIAAGLGAATSVIGNILLVRYMGPGNFGVLGLTMTLVLLVILIGSFGLHDVGAKFIARELGVGNYAGCRKISMVSLRAYVVASLLLTALLFLAAGTIGDWMASDGISEGLKCLAPFVPAIMLLQWSVMVLKGIGWSTRVVFLEGFLLQFLLALLSVGIWFYLPNPMYVITAQGSAYLAVAVLGLVMAKKSLNSLPKLQGQDVSVWKELMRQGFPVTFIGISNRLQRRGDSIIIGTALGDVAVGLYRAAYTLASCTRPLGRVASTFAIHHLSRSYGMNRADLLKSHYAIGVRVGLGLTLPVVFLTIVLAEELLLLLFGEEYVAGKLVVQTLALAQVAIVSGGPVQALFSALKANWLRMRISLVCALITVVGQIVFISLYGLEGVAFATTAGFTLLVVSLVTVANIRFKEFDSLSVQAVSSTLICISAAFLLDFVNLSLNWSAALAVLGAFGFFALELIAVMSLAKKIALQEARASEA